jgi:hypothetical protein
LYTQEQISSIIESIDAVIKTAQETRLAAEKNGDKQLVIECEKIIADQQNYKKQFLEKSLKYADEKEGS